MSDYGCRKQFFFRYVLQGSRPAPGDPFFKRGRSENFFLRTNNTISMKRQWARSAVTADFQRPIYGFRAPSPLSVFVLLCKRRASSESLLVFEDALLLHKLKRQSLFRRDKVPAQNTLRTFWLCLYKPKESFWGSKGAFFKNAPLAGSGTESRKKRRNFCCNAPFQMNQSSKRGQRNPSAHIFYKFFSVKRQLSLHISKRSLSAVHPKSFLAFSALA